MSFTLHLVRHGEVDNPRQVLYGRLPGFRISPRGQQQARAAARWLAARPLAALCSSPMQRARETAAVLAALHAGLPVTIDERLNEVHTPHDGTPLQALLARNWDLYSGSAPHYEQPQDVARRGQACFADLRRNWPAAEVAAVTHGDVIVFAIMVAAGDVPAAGAKADLARYGVTDEYPETASISSFHWRSQDPDERPAFSYLRPW